MSERNLSMRREVRSCFLISLGIAILYPQAPDDEQIMAYMLYDVDKDDIPKSILRFGKTTSRAAHN